MTKILYIPTGEYLKFQNKTCRSIMTPYWEESSFSEFSMEATIRRLCNPKKTSIEFRQRNNLGMWELSQKEFEIIKDD